MTYDVFLASMAAIGVAALMIFLLTRKGNQFGGGTRQSVRTNDQHRREERNHR